ncbi:MAG: hypothetical protein IPL43_00170 [Micropruina sp.]|nr:hypothetical protein [Micropruina sp.]
MTVSPQLRALGILCALILTGCTSPAPTTPNPATPSPTTSATSTPTLTTTWSTGQVAAIKAVEDYNLASAKIGANPSAFSKAEMRNLLQRSIGGAMIEANVQGFQSMRSQGYHREGSAAIVWTVATDVADDGRGLEVHVTQCRDQTSIRIVDKAGSPAPEVEFQYPSHNLRQYSVRKPPGEESFRVFGMQTVNGACP